MIQTFSKVLCPLLAGQKVRIGLDRTAVRAYTIFGALWQQNAVQGSPPKMPPCNFTPHKYESLSFDRVLAIRNKNLTPTLMTFYKKPLLIHQGYMQWLWDFEGQRYLDLFAGIVTVSVGHCHPRVTVAAQKQLSRLWHTTSIYMHPPIHEYAEKLMELLPDPLKVLFLANSGSEANDLAAMLARVYTGSFDIVTFRGGYHGVSPYTMGLTAISNWKQSMANGFGCHPTMCPDVFRGPWGGSHCRDSPVQTIRTCNCCPGSCDAKDKYILQLKDVLSTCVPKQIAGFIAEPIQGVNGTVQYPKGFLKEAYQLIREKGGVCIADEVQTGFGRTGSHYWGFQTHDVIPDIVTMAKGIGNGFPMAAVVTTPEIAKSLTQAHHFNTFGGNPVACAVGSAVLDVIKDDGLQKNCENIGTYFLVELGKLRDEFESIGDVRGKGLMIGVEMVKDKTFRIKPPMCITKEDVDFAVAVFHIALQRHEERKNCTK
ncbi:alanine--glyoxylate aminotransferase 2, mitochondrial isoform X2 [Latimeria chalumnae]|uniref:alanine--glyoxylate aminotransferase 2, mitochondrial isoform X2 n=1 Tax=Latimeria chalumnae TaxID=7897 RepID=UPI0003C137DD|nr:PREDICTED: alanine--glyoxylate aminotransferase 2, mitochondrial isoform X2 [Latimeria chalumnae]|eukprot:XP_006002353.1 PREDICTED: alanine--glyoxylate aminotransferase 2, mitochondrial isoform X2 [Latimeria chalumnae]